MDEQQALDYDGKQHEAHPIYGGTNPRRPSGVPSDTAGFLQEQGPSVQKVQPPTLLTNTYY